MYKVGPTVFKTFEEVAQWAADTYKIDPQDGVDFSTLTEEQKQLACAELNAMLSGDEIMGA